MGKAAKAHRAKVEKRNRKVSQDRYSMQNALNKMMKKMVEEKQNEELQVKVGNENVPFEVVF
jgi:trimethylamine:corrinoid methyltransferase-like protein